jgi:ligand-binding sensor domain-containing protein
MYNKILHRLLYVLLWQACLVYPLLNQAQKSYSFEHIGKDKGLSQGTVNTIFQDSRGLMWFGTSDGLNSYDGVKMTVYRYRHDNPSGLQSNNILSLAEDLEGMIWVGTFGGNIQYFDPKREVFHTPKLNNINSPDFPGVKNAYSIAHQDNGAVWVGTTDGLFRIDPEHKSVDQIIPTHKHPDIEVGSIYALLINNGHLWIGMENGGLATLDLHTHDISIYKKMQIEREFIVETYRGTIMSIAKGPDGKLYAGTFGDYIYLIDEQTQTLKQLNKEIARNRDTGYGFIRSMIAIDDSNLWAGTNSGGIQILNVYTLENDMIEPIPHNPFSLSYDNIKSIYKDKQGGIWIGTNGMGIDYHFPYTKNFGKITAMSDVLYGLSFNSVRSIYRDPADGRLWVSGYNGLDVFNKDLKRQTIYFGDYGVYVIHPDPDDNNILWIGFEGSGLAKMDKRNGHVLREFKDHWDGNQHIKGTVIHSIADGPGETLWVGTERALNLLDKKTNTVTFYLHKPEDEQSLPDFRIRALYNDSKERLWVGTLGGGLAYLEAGKNTFRRFYASNRQNRDMRSNTILCIFESSTGQICIGTDLGLHIFDEQTETFQVLTTVDGLPNDVIYGILEDASGYLWISTNEGISKFDPINRTFTNYDEQDGLQANEFNSGAYFRDHEDFLYFGGINGLNYFKPSQINENPIIPEIVFTNLTVNN